MEQFEPLTKFFDAIEDDVRINTSHISVYLSLLQIYNANGGINPFGITRVAVMRMAKINARSTYNKCLNNLHEFGYIKYIPSSASGNPSLILLLGLGKEALVRIDKQ
ncbi:hypothetical protein [Ferruginibacter sp.]